MLAVSHWDILACLASGQSLLDFDLQCVLGGLELHDRIVPARAAPSRSPRLISPMTRPSESTTMRLHVDSSSDSSA
jgi:hypothetical protein